MPEEKVSQNHTRDCCLDLDHKGYCKAAPAADAAPRQPEPQVSELLGKYLNTMVSDLRIERKGYYLRWLFSQYERELAIAPPVPQEAADTKWNDEMPRDNRFHDPLSTATAPDSAMRVARELIADVVRQAALCGIGVNLKRDDHWAALIREAGGLLESVRRWADGRSSALTCCRGLAPAGRGIEMNDVEVIQVIHTRLLRRGDGEKTYIRIIDQYWDMGGNLMWEVDPLAGGDTVIKGDL